jgi:FtsP/CotA-like multicopper oxidase with cupredoxin domain
MNTDIHYSKPSSRDQLTRRQVLKLGLATGGASLLGWKVIRNAMADDNGGRGDSGSGVLRPSPATRPFLADLPSPAPPQPVAPFQLGSIPPFHQRIDEFPPRKFYDIRMREALHTFHPDLPPTRVWGYNGLVPGPTFMERYGVPILVRFRNDLPPNHVGFGIPSTIVHQHGGHTASESDGFPLDFVGPGQFRDHHYPNILPGNDPAETESNLWYHDHRVDFTAPNVYRGLAGFYILFDDVDSGDETDPNPEALRLPSGPFDIPLVVQDKQFDPLGQLTFDEFSFDGFLGDKPVVNGIIQPRLRVARRKYRFRFLDAANSRFFQFFLSSGQPFIQIGTGAGLFPRPLRRESFLIAPAQRVDVVVDFSHARIGDQIFLLNRLEQVTGRGPTFKLLDPGTPMVRFDVDRDAPDPSRVPDFLRALPAINLQEVRVRRLWEFERSNGAWQVNGRFFEGNRVDAMPQRGSAEIWTLRNKSGGWSHPIHIHLEPFQVLSSNLGPLTPDQMGKKDVIILRPNEELKVFLRFRTFLGRYPMHCHNTVHEDHAMMVRWDVVP